ncbi:hypothetical protein BSPWISOXPB_5023 [uncultured Gammaproteobacteria bacterium]|nr:hypothetical protein BSPWISOXPB_5023 [uncultured Gammaproteobacteria bacterium]
MLSLLMWLAGFAAELGGGKFANGGMSAAFSRMFNDLAVKLRDSAISLKDPVIQGLISGGIRLGIADLL